MKNKSDKQKELDALRQQLQQDPTIFVAGYERMTVSQDYELRKTVRAAGGSYHVVKNNLAAKASEGLASGGLLGELKGMTSLAYTVADPVALAKALTAYAKINPSFTFKAGFVEGRVVEVKNIQDLATMPSKEELIATLMFLINSSSQRIAVSLNGVGRNLAVALNEAIKAEKFQS